MPTYGKQGSGLATQLATLGADGATFDCPVAQGDGEYDVVLDTATSGAIAVAALRMNGANLTTPRYCTINGVDTPNTYSTDAGITGNLFWTRGGWNPTSLHIKLKLSIRNGAVCSWTSIAWATDGSRRETSISSGQHSPAASVTSIGFSCDGLFTAGGTIRATRTSS